MKNKIDTTLIDRLSALAKKEKRIRQFKSRERIGGRVLEKGMTKNGSIRLVVLEGEIRHNLIVLRTHKERFAVAERLKAGDRLQATGIRRFRALICTQLKAIVGPNERQLKLA